MGKEKTTIIILIILLALALGYIGYVRFQAREFSVYQAGAQYGYEGAIAQIFQKAGNCEQVPIYVQNQSINLIAVECLNLEQEKNSSK